MLKRLAALVIALLIPIAASAALTPAQLQTLHTNILADPDFAAVPNTSDGADFIANNAPTAYNKTASPSFYVWRTSLLMNDVMGQPGFDWTRVDNLTVGKARIWEYLKMTGTINPSQANVRAGIEACWSVEAGDQTTRQAIYDRAARFATRGEKLFATGAGTAPTHHGVGPAAMTVEGSIHYLDVLAARNLP